MQLVSFENSFGQRRIGAVTHDGRIVDLNAACVLYLRDVERAEACARLSDAIVPADMRRLFEGGDTSLEAARKGFDHVLDQEGPVLGVRGEPVFYAAEEVRLKAPIIPKKFFHTSATFREHHDEAPNARFYHHLMPRIIFF